MLKEGAGFGSPLFRHSCNPKERGVISVDVLGSSIRFECGYSGPDCFLEFVESLSFIGISNYSHGFKIAKTVL